MATKKPRINVTFEKDTVIVLISIAKKEHKSVSSLAKELIMEALERREDKVLSDLVKSRDVKKAKTVEHDDAWK